MSDRVTAAIVSAARSGPAELERLPVLPRIYYWLVDANEQVIPDEELLVEGQDFDMRLDPSESGFEREFYQSGRKVNEADFERVFRRLCFDGMTYVDVGANVGYFPLVVASECDPERIVAFEPQPRNVELLRQNAGLNDVDLVIESRAASDETTTRHWDASDDMESGSLAADGTDADADGEIETVRLDEYLDGASIEHVDLLKVDVEGAEGLVLEGLGDAIDRVDAIALELHTTSVPDFGHDPADIVAKLLDARYDVYHMDNAGGVDAIDRERLDEMDVPAELAMTPNTVHILLAVRSGSRITDQVPRAGFEAVVG